MPSLNTVLAAKLAAGEASATEPAMPRDFIPVAAGCPDHDGAVLAIRRSSVQCAQFEIITARYMLAYRSTWRDMDGNTVSDSGNEILGWREAPEWLLPDQ
jgi:hypothetical protein